MLGLSWMELGVVALVAILLIKPEELPAIVRGVKLVFRRLKGLGQEFSTALKDLDPTGDLKEEADKLNQDIGRIVDMYGNEQETYSLDDILPELQKTKPKKAAKKQPKKKVS